ncbi:MULTISPECIES: hypothetical protein [Chromobacteriaceae]|uniref:Uncharacterized protein n=1 Tax=Pseudogulbenkiania ferrooxidans EGD-HP2 TaxID=1388764 RepID=A0ABN0NA91_9NEIS|nr:MULTISPECIES: hypothetical protein [Chromobacteriaceae]ERE17472.1 hypothetical protein O166_03430 [Pseudogulbenkiania ferrooxidans EGD-HP2]KMN50894.1 hypothetical protein VK93_05885 [Chromobacterium violaceum]KMN85216.1 hypothetical protein VL02_15180 [Chromobacterium violaceum]KMN89485.1 hypothetical protein VL04_13160 [Chromobacterium violaceum]KMO03527.1 hypothetical protein VL16_10915 [Chromobacterium violaceum]
MDRVTFLEYLTTALRAITTPRFYETERGFQGALQVELMRVIPEDFLPDKVIIEQEYQKRLSAHGLAIRPDIILHDPFDPSRHHSPRDGNIAVMELKRAATAGNAAADIRNLVRMMEILEYPLAIFLNIASEVTYANAVPAEWREQIVCFAVSLRNAEVHVVRSDMV